MFNKIQESCYIHGDSKLTCIKFSVDKLPKMSFLFKRKDYFNILELLIFNNEKHNPICSIWLNPIGEIRQYFGLSIIGEIYPFFQVIIHKDIKCLECLREQI